MDDMQRVRVERGMVQDIFVLDDHRSTHRVDEHRYCILGTTGRQYCVTIGSGGTADCDCIDARRNPLLWCKHVCHVLAFAVAPGVDILPFAMQHHIPGDVLRGERSEKRRRLEGAVERRNQECSICMEHIETDARTCASCKNGFHARCVTRWLRTHRSCPMCRDSGTIERRCC